MATKTTTATPSRLPCGGTPYEDVAIFINSFIRCRMNVLGGATGEEMANGFADLFASNNPNFDRSAFLLACGLESEG